jgi:alanyl-tRNA synthetase
MLSAEIRNTFLKFFNDNGHEIVDSSSVVPHADPSLLFTNAGMVQFKNVFTGIESRKCNRATTSQKCIRAGGKHNDLDQVGFTARHHTFFEMLGNFSFGDYFKDEAIHFAWELLTKKFSIPKDKLLVTVYHDDEEAKCIWKKVAGNIQIIPIATSDNFWSMGDIGPCGPCSEIFFDHGSSVRGGMPGSEEQDGDRYMEIWNIVFMQYEQLSGGKRVNLKRQSIDTGMGLERIASVLQGVHDNYETDLFRNIICKIRDISKTKYENTHPSYKVIADHIRSISFLISDGVLPSNEGRGYVFRRILRRAMRHGNMIGIKEPFLFKLSSVFIEVMRNAYPELKKNESTISSIIQDEEEKFLVTLDRGLKILQNDIKDISSGGILGGDIAFKLYDTYGFPLDLTQDILKIKDISVDVSKFNSLLDEQRNRAKWVGSGAEKEEEIWISIKEKVGNTKFVGYEKEFAESEVLSIVKDGVEINELESGKAFLLTASTPFYAESGGQCGDTGVIKCKNGAAFKVCNTLKFCSGVIAHEGEIISGKMKLSDNVLLEIDTNKRKKIGANHTATHLLQAALRVVLGDHITQRGSFHNEEKLRFDFSHNSAISCDNLEKIEKLINCWIFDGLMVTTETMPKDDAIKFGATALFGEKYGDSVRTVNISDDVKHRISFELCGGTHVSCTSEIGLFKILSETSVGSGIRRIEAVTGMAVFNYLSNLENVVNSISSKLKCSTSEIIGKTEDLIQDLKKKNQELAINLQKNALNAAKKIEKSGICVLSMAIHDYKMNDIRSVADLVKAKYPINTVSVIISKEAGNKINMLILVSKDLEKKYSADVLLKNSLPLINGNGGGNSLLAQGSGIGEADVDDIIKSIINRI